MTTIGIAVPCYKNHIKYIPQLIANLQSQTRKPDQIVISCSSVDAAALAELECLPQTELDIRLIPIKEQKNGSSNRNIAAAHLNTDLIAFFDVDDLMHPQRIEFVLSIYEKTKFDVLYHNYIGMADEFTKYTNCDIHILDAGTKPVKPAHHAHVTVRRQVFDQIKWPEGKLFEGAEDSAYLTLVTFPEAIVTVYTPQALSKYESTNIFVKGLKMRHLVRGEFGL
jgi:glycosyltransferase involved in cell wall biosynthesis